MYTEHDIEYFSKLADNSTGPHVINGFDDVEDWCFSMQTEGGVNIPVGLPMGYGSFKPVDKPTKKIKKEPRKLKPTVFTQREIDQIERFNSKVREKELSTRIEQGSKLLYFNPGVPNNIFNNKIIVCEWLDDGKIYFYHNNIRYRVSEKFCTKIGSVN